MTVQPHRDALIGLVRSLHASCYFAIVWPAAHGVKFVDADSRPKAMLRAYLSPIGDEP